MGLGPVGRLGRAARADAVDIESGYVHEVRRRLLRPVKAFDRIAFAKRLLGILQPAGMRVALYEGRWELRVERGRSWGEGPGETWAMVGIPPHATREHIAVALAELAGYGGVPFVVDLLLTQGASGASTAG